jgi:hypothetical protein
MNTNTIKRIGIVIIDINKSGELLNIEIRR